MLTYIEGLLKTGKRPHAIRLVVALNMMLDEQQGSFVRLLSKMQSFERPGLSTINLQLTSLFKLLSEQRQLNL